MVVEVFVLFSTVCAFLLLFNTIDCNCVVWITPVYSKSEPSILCVVITTKHNIIIGVLWTKHGCTFIKPSVKFTIGFAWGHRNLNILALLKCRFVQIIFLHIGVLVKLEGVILVLIKILLDTTSNK